MFKGRAIKTIVKWLAKRDGIKGFSFNDIIAFVQLADTITELTGADKANKAIHEATVYYNTNRSWIIQTIVQLGYVYARMKGLLNR